MLALIVQLALLHPLAQAPEPWLGQGEIRGARLLTADDAPTTREMAVFTSWLAAGASLWMGTDAAIGLARQPALPAGLWMGVAASVLLFSLAPNMGDLLNGALERAAVRGGGRSGLVA